MDNGWIKLHRSFLDWEWFTCPKTCQVFIYCMLRANHTDTKWRGVPVKRGQFLTSYEKLSSGTGLSVRNIRTALKNLESTGEVTRESTSQLTKLTICKYGIYNNSDSQGDKPTDKQATNERQTNDKQATTDKKEKNLKNEKNEEELMAFDYFRRGYKNAGGNVRGNETEFKDFTKKHKDWRVVLPDLDSLLKCIINERVVKKRAGLFVPDWKHLKTWLYNRCWEEEQTKEIKKEWRPS